MTVLSGGTLTWQCRNLRVTGQRDSDNGILHFNRNDTALTLTGAITGTGSLVQFGTGSTTLSGVNSYMG